MSTRSWSDDELRGAIASQRSWRGTARALGLKGTSAGTIRALKQRARSLELDVSHFTGQRPWSDRQLREAVGRADSWSDVLRTLQITDRGDARIRLRGHAKRLRIDTSHIEPPLRDPQPIPLRDLPPSRSMLRLAAEPFAVAWFTMRGMPVALPAQPCPYDLLVTFQEGVRRVQVKTSTSWGYGSWVVQIGWRPYVLDKTASRIPYDPDSLDYFFVIDGDGAIYLIPSQVVGGVTAISVGAYQDYFVGQASEWLGSCSNADATEQMRGTS
jgi:hypothetical protein